MGKEVAILYDEIKENKSNGINRNQMETNRINRNQQKFNGIDRNQIESIEIKWNQ